MDTTKHPAAAAAALSARFRAMQLVSDPSSPQPQPQPPFWPTTMRQLELPAPPQQYCRSQPQPQPRLQQITGADLLRKLDLPAAPAQQCHHPPTRPQSYDMGESSTVAGQYVMGESSTVAGYVSPYASCSINASHFGNHSPRHNAAPKLPLPVPNASQFDPNPNPIYYPPNPSAPRPPSSSTLRASANLFQPAIPMEDPNRAAYWDDHDAAVFNPYASAAFQSLLAAGYRSSLVALGPPPRSPPATTLAQVRSRLIGRPMPPELLASPVAAAYVARLLDGGDDVQARRSVLATFKRDVRCFMESSAHRQAVFLALVRACVGRVDELEDIVTTVCNTNGFLLGVVQHNYGLTALKELITAVVPPHHRQLLRPMVDWILREPLFYKCTELVEHCFVKMPYEYSKVLIRFAIVHHGAMLTSSSGSRSLSQCFMYARDKDEVDHVERIILDCTAMLAVGRFGNYVLQRVIECGDERLQAAIAERIAADVVNLSSDQFGSYVVESCILQARSPAPPQIVLNAFLALGDDDLAGLVRGGFSNYVVSKLLVVAMDNMPAQARELARRIERLPAAIHREMHARGVMAVVRKLIHRAQAARLY